MISGVSGRTSHLALLHEFGRSPMSHSFIKLSARFWNKVMAMDDTRLLKQAMLDDIVLMIKRKCTVCWAYHFLSTMHHLGLCASADAFSSIQECTVLNFPEVNVTSALTARALSFCTPLQSPVVLPRCPRTCPSSSVTGFTYR